MDDEIIIDPNALKSKRSSQDIRCDKLLNVPVRKVRWWDLKSEDEEEVQVVELDDDELQLLT